MIPSETQAMVIINEVAWMGTVVNANDEWIELYNNGNDSVAVDGWVLDDGASLSINLAGTIGAGDYALLERTDDDTVPGKSAFLIYTGALSNDGRTLTLTRSDSSIEDQVVGGSAWENIGGDNITKNTAQRTTTGWVTDSPTPGEQNSTVSSFLSENTSSNNTEGTNTQSISVSRSGGSSVQTQKKQIEQKNLSEPVLTLQINAPKIVYVNQKVDFEVVASGLGKTVLNSLTYIWNYGDAYTGGGKKVSHIFEYPGEYIVVVRGRFAKHDVTVRQEIKVLPTSFMLTRTLNGDIQIKNNAKYEVDLGGFLLRGQSTFVFPELTIMKAGGELTISRNRVMSGQSTVALLDTENSTVATIGIIGPRNVPIQKQVARTQKKEELVAAAELPVLNEQSQVEEKIIQIGNPRPVIETGGSVQGFFKKIAYFFGFK